MKGLRLAASARAILSPMERPALKNSDCQAAVRNPAHHVILLVQDQAVSRPIGNGWSAKTLG